MTTKKATRKLPVHARRLAAIMQRERISDARLEVASGVSSRTIAAVRLGRTDTIRSVTADALARGLTTLLGRPIGAEQFMEES